MASLLGSRNFASASGGSGVARAKKVADIYIKNHTNDAGDVTDPEVYSYVIDNILGPYADDLSVQQKIGGYQNKVKDLKASNFDQDNTLGIFKQNVSNSLYSSGNVIRDPAKMALFSASALDNVLNSLDAAIAHGDATGKPTTGLADYRKQVAEMAGAQRDLANALNSGTAPQNLDGYGYFVKTNPIDGSLVGAALLPVNSVPDDLKQGTGRIDNTISVGGSKIPVYVPYTKDADGQYTAKLYGNTWTSTDASKTFSSQDTPNFQNKDAFDITDQATFPLKKNVISNGSFGRVVAGVKDGQTQYSYYYRGQDGKVRQVDQAGLQAFQQDPIFANKVSGYIPILSPDDVKNLGSVDRLNPSEVPSWSNQAEIQKQTAASISAPAPAPSAQELANQISSPVQGPNLFEQVGGAIKGFFSRKNQPNKPDQAPQGDKTSYSAPDVVDKGRSIFAGGGTNGGNVA